MRALAAGLIAAGLIGVCGCSKDSYSNVTGVVLLDGTPLPEASVAFVPEDPSGEGATGYTDENGRFTMTSSRTTGVKPGLYKVRIEALADKPEPSKGMGQIMQEKYGGGGGGVSTKDLTKGGTDAYKAQTKEGKEAAKKVRRATPAIYNDHEKTPLRADVPAKTEYKFELTKDAK